MMKRIILSILILWCVSTQAQFKMKGDTIIHVNGSDTVWLNTKNVPPSNTVFKKLASDVSVTITGGADLTGLSFTAEPNTTYDITFLGAYSSAVTTTGIAVFVDIPDGSIIGFNATNTSTTALGGTYQNADNATLGAGSTGVSAININVPIEGRWVYASGSTGGTVQLRFKTEVAATAVTMKANLSILKYTKLK